MGFGEGNVAPIGVRVVHVVTDDVIHSIRTQRC